jgi:hypothetical protein
LATNNCLGSFTEVGQTHVHVIAEARQFVLRGLETGERSAELDPDLRPRLRAPVRVQHHAREAVDAESGVPERGVGVVHFPRPTHGEAYLSRLVQVAKNDSVGNPHKFIRTVRALSAY